MGLPDIHQEGGLFNSHIQYHKPTFMRDNFISRFTGIKLRFAMTNFRGLFQTHVVITII